MYARSELQQEKIIIAVCSVVLHCALVRFDNFTIITWPTWAMWLVVVQPHTLFPIPYMLSKCLLWSWRDSVCCAVRYLAGETSGSMWHPRWVSSCDELWAFLTHHLPAVYSCTGCLPVIILMASSGLCIRVVTDWTRMLSRWKYLLLNGNLHS